MIDLIRMIGVRGNITSEEARRLKAKPAKKSDRIADGRAPLQAAILAHLRASPDTWHSCTSIAAAIGHTAQSVTYAANRMVARGLLVREQHTIPVLNRGGKYCMRKINHYMGTAL